MDFSLTNTPVCSNAIAVQNANDTGANSLRQALADACDGGIITFNSSLNNQTLTLLSELAVSKTVTIDGTGLVVRLDGNNHSNRIINASVPITLTNLTLQNAGGSSVGTGGAVQALGGATLTSVTFQNNTANNQGGALFAGGATTITNSTFTGNQTTVFDSGVTYGGAIHFASTGTVINSTFTNNNSATHGGAISTEQANGYHQVIIQGSTFSGNTADNGGAIQSSDPLDVSTPPSMATRQMVWITPAVRCGSPPQRTGITSPFPAAPAAAFQPRLTR